MTKVFFLNILFILSISNLTYAAINMYAPDGIYIEGYDPVSYIVSKKAQKGKREIHIDYKGVKIQFFNQKNKKEFLKKPQKYTPEYGGYCAYAMSKNGSLVSINPKAFKIINGKTYLFYKNVFADTLKKWNKESDSDQIKNADLNWNKLLTQ